MAANEAVQLNKSFVRLPVSVRDLTPSTKFIAAEVFSFSGKDKQGNKLDCHRTYKTFAERLKISRASVARGIKNCRKMALLTGDRAKGYESTINGGSQFLRLPMWACGEFKDKKGKARRLSLNARCVYAYFYTEGTKKGNSKHEICTSNAKIANEAGVSERTAGRAVWALFRLGLIYRKKEDKGINGYKESVYTLNYRLILSFEKSEKEIQKEAESESRRADAVQQAVPDMIINGAEFTYGSQWHNRRRAVKWLKIDIPEMTKFKAESNFGYDFSEASTAELISIARRLSPLFVKLSPQAQMFYLCLQTELEERGASPP